MARKVAWTDHRDAAIDLLHGIARFVAAEERDLKRLQGIGPPN